VVDYRTNQDLIANGVDLNCSGAPQYINPGQYINLPPPVQHYDCPATNSGHVMADSNCTVSVNQVNKSGSGKSCHWIGKMMDVIVFLSLLTVMIYL
jgi:hypothetical protein